MDRSRKPPAGKAGGGGEGLDQYTVENKPAFEIAQAMIDRGLRPVPIKHGTKAPYHGDWQKRHFTAGNFQFNDNVGLLLGDVVAVDVDILDQDIAHEIEALALSSLGPSSCRVGEWPKRALFYRSTEAMKKAVTRLTAAGKVEVLATGQQAIVHGIHPNTGQPYRWRGAPPWVPEFTLTTVTLEQVRQFLHDAEALLGLDPVEASTTKTTTATPLPAAPSIDTDEMPRAEDLAKALAGYWDADARDDWITAGLALTGHPDGEALWMTWSATSPKHTDREAAAKWMELSSSSRGDITAAKILSRVPTAELQAWGRENRIAELANDPMVAEGARIARAIMPSLRSAPEAVDDGEHEEHPDDDEAAHAPPQGHREAVVPEHLLSVPGVLQQVVDFYNETARHAQPQFAVATALAFGGVVMGRRWCSSNRNFASHYHLLVVSTGAGKEHPKTVVEKLLDRANLGRLLGPSDYSSGSAVMASLVRRPAHVAVVDELGRKLAAARRAHNQHKTDSLTIIMEMFGRQDGVCAPQAYSALSIKPTQQDDLERVVRRPSLTLVGMSTPSSLELALDSDDVASGLLNRFIVVRGDDTLRKSRRIDGLPDVPQDLIKWAQETAGAHGGGGNLSGLDTADMPPNPVVVAFDDEAAAVFDDFERELIDLRQQQPARDLMARSLEISMRLALIVARSTGANTITAEAAQWAVSYVKHHHLRFLADVGALTASSDFERQVQRVVEAVRRAGARGCTARDLAKAVRGWGAVKPHEREAVLKVAVADHGLRPGQRQPKAGPKTPCWFIR